MTLGDLGGIHVTLNTTNKWGVTRFNYHPSLVVIGLKLFIWDHFFKTLTKMSHYTCTLLHTPLHTYTDRNSDCIVSFPEQVQARQKGKEWLCFSTSHLPLSDIDPTLADKLTSTALWCVLALEDFTPYAPVPLVRSGEKYLAINKGPIVLVENVSNRPYKCNQEK